MALDAVQTVGYIRVPAELAADSINFGPTLRREWHRANDRRERRERWAALQAKHQARRRWLSGQP